ncbi:hypothetical protein Pflav_054020 [Phytohabitans flavus]|uniref:Uncharacterized protein n=1 Tax=Phytohabitans flavus TaxID=1076124 RepID=A0A6F8XYQ0_9ACTN|nr:hypothetical protein Pflav_054020 [Phytohabitans flavus]
METYESEPTRSVFQSISVQNCRDAFGASAAARSVAPAAVALAVIAARQRRVTSRYRMKIPGSA